MTAERKKKQQTNKQKAKTKFVLWNRYVRRKIRASTN